MDKAFTHENKGQKCEISPGKNFQQYGMFHMKDYVDSDRESNKLLPSSVHGLTVGMVEGVHAWLYKISNPF